MQAPTFAFLCAKTVLPRIWAKAQDELHPVKEVPQKMQLVLLASPVCFELQAVARGI